MDQVLPDAVVTSGTPTESGITNGFLEVPRATIVAVGKSAKFYCNHSTTQDIAWRVNDTSLSVLKLSTITTQMIRVQTNDTVGDGFVHELAIQALTEYNQTSVYCLAYIDGSPVEYSPEVTMLIQGVLDPVRNIKRNGSIISWEPPFSLDLTNTDPNIIYCVEVYNITCGETDRVFVDCNVVDNMITCLCEPSFIYEVLVTPRSNVDQAMNGTLFTVREQFKFVRDSLVYIRGVYHNNLVDLNIVLELPLPVKVSGDVQPSMYTLLLTSADGLYDERVVYSSVNSETETVFILEANLTLAIKTLWDVTVLAYGCTENPITNGHELSTHDVQHITVTSKLGVVNISGDFVEQSTAIGILAVVYALTESDPVDYYLLVPRLLEQQWASSIFECIQSGTYNISLFSVEEGDLPFNRAATKVRTLSVDQGRNINCPSYKIFFDTKSMPSDSSICITCTFVESSATDCVAVVHQRISQLSSSGLMNIESSHKFNRSGNTAYGCIEGVNVTENQVGVIGATLISTIKPQMEPITCGMDCIITSVIGGLTVIIVIIAILAGALYTIFRKKAKANSMRCNGSASGAGIAMQIKTDKCAAYEVFALKQQKVVMKENPAYEEISPSYATIS